MSGIVGGVDAYASLRTGLTAQWKLNEASGNALDSVGGFDLTESGTCGSTTGKINICRTNTTTAYFTRAATTAIAGVNLSFTWTGWVYSPAMAGGRIINIRNGGNFCVDIRHDGTNIVVFLGNGAGGFSSSYTIIPSPSNSTWYHFGVAYNVSTNKIKTVVNGVASSESTPSVHPTALGSANLQFFADGSGLNPFVGQLDCVKLWSGLYQTDANLLLDYNGGNGVEL